MYEVRLKFPHIPVDKNFMERRFYSIQSLDDFLENLDPKEFENYEIREVNVIDRVCISDMYCPERSKCSKCVFRRREDYEISDFYNKRS